MRGSFASCNPGSKPGGVIEECPRKLEFPPQNLGEAFDAEGFRGVMAAVKKIDAQLLG